MIADKLAQVHARIASACAAAGRPVQSVTLLAVSKTFGIGGDRGGARRRPAALWRELRAGSAREDRRARQPRAASRMAPDRAAAEQQDARRRRKLRLGPFGRSPQDRRAAQRASGRRIWRRSRSACRSTSAARPARAASPRPRSPASRMPSPRCRGCAARPDGDSRGHRRDRPGGAAPAAPRAARALRCRCAATASRSTRSRPG